MKKNMEAPKGFVREAQIMNGSYYDFGEDDFLVGKTPEFFPDVWEDEE